VEDYANAKVYANLSVDGTLYNFVGTITELADIPVADSAALGSDEAERNTEIVLTAMRELFAEKVLTAADGYVAEPYAQRRRQMPDGLEALRSAAPDLRGFSWDLQRTAAHRRALGRRAGPRPGRVDGRPWREISTSLPATRGAQR
jgi:hypothetical protein